MSELDKCIERGSLKRLDAAGTDAVEIELRAACEDLADAEFVHEHGMHKRTTITAYYGTEGEGRELARGIERARVLRENADYNAEFGEESAEAALEVARRFVRFATEVTNQGL
jgi:uncharacterized protein (UPF0332 family)